LRSCLCEPIPKVAEAARYLDAAIDAHVQGKVSLVAELIRAADMPEIRQWTKSVWADSRVHLRRPSSKEQPSLTKELRTKARMPTAADKTRVHKRDGHTDPAHKQCVGVQAA
jgi:hypothetical protein